MHDHLEIDDDVFCVAFGVSTNRNSLWFTKEFLDLGFFEAPTCTYKVQEFETRTKVTQTFKDTPHNQKKGWVGKKRIWVLDPPCCCGHRQGKWPD